jgi:cytochrome c oxidase assembly protein subunit 15
VLFLLPKPISIAHAGLAEIFFCLNVSIAFFTSRWYDELRKVEKGDAPVRMAWGLTTLVYLQVLAGALMRHMGAGLAIPDFPLAYGGLVPPSLAGGIAIHFAHRVGALVVTIAVLAVLGTVLARHRNDAWLVRPAAGLLVLVSLQILLGALTIWSVKAVLPTTLHVAVGASTLATSLILTLRAFRRFRVTAPHRAHAILAREATA